MKTLKLIQILFIASSFTACTGGKNRSKVTGGKRTESTKQTKTDAPMERKQNGTETTPVDPASPPPVKDNKKADTTVVAADEVKAPPVLAPAPAPSTPVALPAAPAAPAATPTTPAAQAEKAPAIASDTQEIKDAEKQAKISFKNLESLKKLSSKADMVIMEGANLTRDEAMTKLIAGGESHFCKVSGLEKFNEKDFLKLANGTNTVVDEENDLHNSKLSFENKNVKANINVEAIAIIKGILLV